MSILQFQGYHTIIDILFWQSLVKKKKEEFKLDDSIQPIYGYYIPSPQAGQIPQFHISGFTKDEYVENCINQNSLPNDAVVVQGFLKNTNTFEEYKSLQLQDLLNEVGEKLRERLENDHSKDGNRFLLAAFADLKKFSFYYIVSHVAISFEEGFRIVNEVPYENNEEVSDEWLYEQESNTLIFKDPSKTQHPGYPLRNALFWAKKKYDLDQINVVRLGVNKSLNISFPKDCSKHKFVGWEKNNQGKIGTKRVNLSSLMSPEKLMETAADLNLKLMKWRIIPELDLDLISNLSCLLLGAGTLGCNVARCLLGWGIHKITFVDEGRVSFSNPVRQSLFTFEDAKLNKFKAEAAVENMKLIYPLAQVQGVKLSIPMPGHFIEPEKVKGEIEQLTLLIENHDIIFLLTDSRESRWLPTVLGALKDKIVITIALGFDSFLVMRHGSPKAKERLGCYYCNDVVVPLNSLKDRTLDQQCTVTRPGISFLASAIGVELVAALSQNPLK